MYLDRKGAIEQFVRSLARELGPDGITTRPRYRLLREGTIVDFDGFEIPTPREPQGLDLNRNFPAGLGTTVTGSGEFEIHRFQVTSGQAKGLNITLTRSQFVDNKVQITMEYLPPAA